MKVRWEEFLRDSPYNLVEVLKVLKVKTGQGWSYERLRWISLKNFDLEDRDCLRSRLGLKSLVESSVRQMDFSIPIPGVPEGTESILSGVLWDF